MHISTWDEKYISFVHFYIIEDIEWSNCIIILIHILFTSYNKLIYNNKLTIIFNTQINKYNEKWLMYTLYWIYVTEQVGILPALEKKIKVGRYF